MQKEAKWAPASTSWWS